MSHFKLSSTLETPFLSTDTIQQFVLCEWMGFQHNFQSASTIERTVDDWNWLSALMQLINN
mgnify:CR=1 FL=1